MEVQLLRDKVILLTVTVWRTIACFQIIYHGALLFLLELVIDVCSLCH